MHVICRFHSILRSRRWKEKKKDRIDKSQSMWELIGYFTDIVRTLTSNITFEYDYLPDNVLHPLVAAILDLILSHFLSQRGKLRKCPDR